MADIVRLDKSDGYTQVIVSVPPEHEEAIDRAIKTLLASGNQIDLQERLLELLITLAEQSYFWTPEWQADERQVDEQRKQGKYETFNSMDDMLDFLDKQ